MILGGPTIRERVEEETIGVEPAPETEQYQPASLDLRFGSELYNVTQDRELYGTGITLQPGDFYLGHTVEYVSIPREYAALITGRSSVGRKGVIVHCTAGFVDPGFEGQLTLELYNFSGEPIRFNAGEDGDRVAQLIFFATDGSNLGYDGQYKGQRGATRSGEL